MNYAAERFLYRLSQSRLREQFVLKGAMLFAVRVGERYRPTRDLDLLGMGEATEEAIRAAVREIAATKVDDDGLVFDMNTLEVHAIREDNRYGGIRAIMQAHLAEARIHVQIDVGFGDAITPAATNMNFPTLLDGMASPNVLAYPNETIVAEKAEAIVDLGLSNSRLKDFTDIAMAARRWTFDGDTLVAALQATFRRSAHSAVRRRDRCAQRAFRPGRTCSGQLKSVRDEKPSRRLRFAERRRERGSWFSACAARARSDGTGIQRDVESRRPVGVAGRQICKSGLF
jgi:hypothetical protein